MKWRWKSLRFCSLPKLLMYWHIGSVCYPFCQMCRTFCAPCNLGVQTLFIHDIKSFDNNHALHQVLKFLKKNHYKRNMRELFQHFSHAVNYWKMLICMYICLFGFRALFRWSLQFSLCFINNTERSNLLSYVSQNPLVCNLLCGWTTAAAVTVYYSYCCWLYATLIISSLSEVHTNVIAIDINKYSSAKHNCILWS